MNKHTVARQLLIDEGLRLKPYRCTAGKLTIGVGRNLDDRGITEPEAMGLLDNDIRRVWSEVMSNLPWAIRAPEVVQDVLVNMGFNLGLGGLLGFKRTLAHLEAGEYGKAADAMLDSRWAGQVGERAQRLARQIRALESGAGTSTAEVE